MPSPPAKITAREFNALPRGAQLDLLRQAGARQKLRLLLDAADGEELLALLPVQDVYLLARELGPDQIPELLGMVSADQWTTLFDFDCWEGDRFAPGTARTWLAVLLEGDEPRVVEILLGIDPQLLVLMLKEEVRVLSGPEDIPAEMEGGEAMRRDGGYVLDYRDEDGAKLYGALLDLLFRHAPEDFRALLEAVRAEGVSELEEDVYRQRAGRLLDLGFPEPYAARAVYAWLDPERFVVGTGTKIPLVGSASGVVPGAALQLAGLPGLLGQALAAAGDGDTQWELACLANKLLMAEQVDLGDLTAVRDAVKRGYDTLNLALEFLAGSDPLAAARTMNAVYLEELFRLGHSLTLRLQRRARDVQASAIGAYLEGGEKQLVEALLPHRPQFPAGLESPGSSGRRNFASVSELRLAEVSLDRLEAVRRLFDDHFPFALPAPGAWALAGCHPGSGTELSLATIFLTALANRLLERPFAPVPLSPRDLPLLHAQITRGGHLDPELRMRTSEWMESLEPGAGAFGAASLEAWAEGFCAVDAGRLDPRYLSGLIIRTG